MTHPLHYLSKAIFTAATAYPSTNTTAESRESTAVSGDAVIPHLRFLLNSLSLGCTCISGSSLACGSMSTRGHPNQPS